MAGKPVDRGSVTPPQPAAKRDVHENGSQPPSERLTPALYEAGTDLLSRFHYHRPYLLNYCVRDGNRCDQTGMGTGKLLGMLNP